MFNNLDGLGYGVNPFEGQGERYIELSGFMSKSWASFVATGDPNGWEGRNESYPEWPSYDLAAPENIVWDGNVTSFVETDDFRKEGIALLNENWGLFLR